ncbi:MAG: hemolysin family protein [Myxococcota bacterium]
MSLALSAESAAPVPTLASAGLPLTVGILLTLLLLCMFFSISETALFSLQKVDREALKDDPSVGETVRHLLHRPRRLLAALLIGNEFANIGLSAVSAALVLAWLPRWPWLNILLVAPILILFGDVLPKTLGLRFARTVTRRIARPLAFWNELVSPIRFVLSGIGDLILRGLGVSPAPLHDSLQEDQLRTLIDQGRETGIIQPMEQEIIHRVFEFGDLPVSRLMTPRPDIFSLSLTTPWDELLQELREARYSRVPIWQSNPDNIVGVLLVKDLLRLRNAPPPHARQLQKMLHPAMFVPPSKRAQDLLREFRVNNNHMAVVVDEHGSIAGLTTLDDLLTELVGEVLDESDVDEKEATQLQENVWTVRAGIDIEDFDARFDTELPEGDYTTLGGFVFHQLGAAPKKGDEVEWNGLHFLVSGVDGRRITEVTVTIRADERLSSEELT